MAVTPSVDTDTTSPKPGNQLDRDFCGRTGLSKPECHCQDCLRDLVARFRPVRDS